MTSEERGVIETLKCSAVFFGSRAIVSALSGMVIEAKADARRAAQYALAAIEREENND